MRLVCAELLARLCDCGVSGLSLQVDCVETNVPFSEYGGDSLSGVSVISRAAKAGITLTLTSTFEMCAPDLPCNAPL